MTLMEENQIIELPENFSLDQLSGGFKSEILSFQSNLKYMLGSIDDLLYNIEEKTVHAKEELGSSSGSGSGRQAESKEQGESLHCFLRQVNSYLFDLQRVLKIVNHKCITKENGHSDAFQISSSLSVTPSPGDDKRSESPSTYHTPYLSFCSPIHKPAKTTETKTEESHNDTLTQLLLEENIEFSSIIKPALVISPPVNANQTHAEEAEVKHRQLTHGMMDAENNTTVVYRGRGEADNVSETSSSSLFLSESEDGDESSVIYDDLTNKLQQQVQDFSSISSLHTSVTSPISILSPNTADHSELDDIIEAEEDLLDHNDITVIDNTQISVNTTLVNNVNNTNATTSTGSEETLILHKRNDFSPSSPPISPSPMLSTIASNSEKIEKNLSGLNLNSSGGGGATLTSSTSTLRMMNMTLQKIRNNILDDAVNQKHKSAVVLNAILPKTTAVANHPNQIHFQQGAANPVPTNQAVGLTNYFVSANNIFKNQSRGPQSPNRSSTVGGAGSPNIQSCSPEDSYLSSDDEDLSNIYFKYKDEKQRLFEAQQMQQQQQQAQQVQQQQTQKYSNRGESSRPKVITFTKSDPSEYQFVKEKIMPPRKDSVGSTYSFKSQFLELDSSQCNTISNLNTLTDDDGDDEEGIFDDEVVSPIDQIEQKPEMEVSKEEEKNKMICAEANIINEDENTITTITTTTSSTIPEDHENDNVVTSAKRTNSDTAIQVQQQAQMNRLSPYNHASIIHSGSMSSGDLRERQPIMSSPSMVVKHQKSVSTGGVGKPSWLKTKLMTVHVFVPTSPYISRVEISLDEDVTVERLIIEVLDLCIKERKRLQQDLYLQQNKHILNANSNSPSSNSPIVQSSNTAANNNNPNNNNVSGIIIPSTPRTSSTSSTLSSTSSLKTISPDNSSKIEPLGFPFLTNPNHRAFFMRIANEEGEIDDDCPALDRRSEIRKLKSDCFVLQKNPKFLVSSQPQIFKVYIVASLSPTLSQSHRNSINLNQQQGVKDSIAMIYNPNATLKSIKSIICRKEKFPEDMCVFMTSKNEVICNEMITLEELNLSEGIKLVHDQVKSVMPKSASFIADSGNAPRPITKLLGPMFFFTPDTAGEYKQYSVVKINKFGVKKERYMGIDQDRIVHASINSAATLAGVNQLAAAASANASASVNLQSPSSSSTKKSFRKTFSSNKLKTPTQHINEIASVGLISNKPTNFFIKSIDGKYNEYSSSDSEEIVAKINFIIKEKRNKIKSQI